MRHLFLIGIWLAASTITMAQESFLRPHDKIMWVGDSITAQNLYEPYVMRVLKTLYPGADFSDINCGVGGATASSRFGGIPLLVDQEKPTLMTAMFGVNDTRWSVGDESKKIDDYLGGLRQFVELTKQKQIPLLLLRETHFSHNAAGEDFVYNMNGMLEKLFAAQDKLATETHVPVVDVYGAYTRELRSAWKVDPKYEFTPNVIHPTMLGHTAVAGEILKAVGAGLPLAASNKRGELHVGNQPRVQLSAVPLSGVIDKEKQLEIKLAANNLADQPLDGKLIAVLGEQKFELPLSLPSKGVTEAVVSIAPSIWSQRWDVQPIYLAFVGQGDFAAAETPVYYSQLLPAHDKPFEHDDQGWVEWEGQPT